MTRPSAPQRPRYPADGGAPGGRPPGGRAPDDRPAGRQVRRGRWQNFAGRYGWRAYALPVLSLVTVLAVLNMAAHRGDSQPQAAGSTPVSSGAPISTVGSSSAPASSAPSTRPVASSSPRRASSPPVVLRSWQLPPGPAYTFNGTGVFSTIPGTSGVLGKGQLFRFTIDIENGITGVDPKAFAATVMAALSDQRSWIGSGAVALQRVDSGPVDFRISLAAPTTVRSICGYDLKVETSCNAGSVGRVILNVSRWTRGAVAYTGNLAQYRQYAVNHEVGHALGHNHAHGCLPNGMAPVMMQQTIGTKAAGQTCRPNPWPFPPGVAGAPGDEQVGDNADLEFFQRNQ
ncbi:MAG: DUF3152 domain-containing protein [Actinobacteria bacterium]|nr:DUF3152 domain-containing protein [Actinomycetota bacterium]